MYPFVSFLGKEIPTYGICMLLGISAVILLSLKRAKLYGLVIEDLFIIGAFSLLFALPCASTVFAIATYGIAGFFENIAIGNFKIFKGLVFYGGFIGGIFGGIIGIKAAKVKILCAEKAILPFIPIGHSIGRVGCLMAGCCYGMEYSGIFAVYYRNSVAGASPDTGYFPVQLLEAFLNIIIFFCLIKLSNKCTEKFQLLSVYLILYGVVRFFTEFFRGDAIRGIYFTLSTSQWISVITVTFGSVYLLICVLKRKYLLK